MQHPCLRNPTRSARNGGAPPSACQWGDDGAFPSSHSKVPSHPRQEELTPHDGKEAEGQALCYATPQELLDMQEHDPAGLMRRFEQALEHYDAGGLHPSDLRLPIWRGSPPTYMWFLPGYEGGAYDPEKLGVACIVVPPPTGLGANTLGDFCFKAVPPPPLPSRAPVCPPVIISS